jgi:hypothetical protein
MIRPGVCPLPERPPLPPLLAGRSFRGAAGWPGLPGDVGHPTLRRCATSVSRLTPPLPGVTRIKYVENPGDLGCTRLSPGPPAGGIGPGDRAEPCGEPGQRRRRQRSRQLRRQTEVDSATLLMYRWILDSFSIVCLIRPCRTLPRPRVRWHVFQEGTARLGVEDTGGLVLQERMGCRQETLRTRVAYGPQDPIAGQVDAQRLLAAGPRLSDTYT